MQPSRFELLNLLKFVHDQFFATLISLLLRFFMKKKTKNKFFKKKMIELKKNNKIKNEETKTLKKKLKQWRTHDVWEVFMNDVN